MPPTISSARRRWKRRSLAVDGGPLGDGEFATLMVGLGPFESAPHLAVAVSGGADSLALCLLADLWARQNGGAVTALTVDHRLRAGSADEADQVGAWMAARDIAHRVLPWTGVKPDASLQAAARDARYTMLGQWCLAAGVLHLLLAHHQDDQAETLLLRLGRGSGVDGLAAMAPAGATRPVRLLRPLLTVPRARLEATLRAVGQSWIDDPSNASERFRRVRLRRLMPSLAAEGLDAGRLSATATRLGRARRALEEATARALVHAVSLDPAGFARLHRQTFVQSPSEIRLRMLAALCRTVGGGVYRPRLERLERLDGELVEGRLARRRTFAGCVLASAGEYVLVCREPSAVAGPVSFSGGGTMQWDGRFRLRLEGNGSVAALGGDGWRALRDGRDWPAAAGACLPAVFDHRGLAAVPHLGIGRRLADGPAVLSWAFSPACALAAGF